MKRYILSISLIAALFITTGCGPSDEEGALDDTDTLGSVVAIVHQRELEMREQAEQNASRDADGATDHAGDGAPALVDVDEAQADSTAATLVTFAKDTAAQADASSTPPPCCPPAKDESPVATATANGFDCCKTGDTCDHGEAGLDQCTEPCCETAAPDPATAPIAEQIDAAAQLAKADAQADADESLSPDSALESKVKARAWQKPEDRAAFDFDWDITTHAGAARKLSSFVGKPMAISFMFTNCTNPAMCPMVTVNMANLQRELEKRDLTDEVQLLLISYDPARDTPEALKQYAQARGVRFDNLAMIRPPLEHFRDFVDEMAITVMPLRGGDINHSVELLLVDAQGRFVRDYYGGHWDNPTVADDLQKLVDEANAVSLAD